MPAKSDIALDTAMEEAVAKMDETQRQHFKWLCAALLSCYVNQDLRALVLIGQDDVFAGTAVDLTQIQSVNCNDMHGIQLLTHAMAQMDSMLMADAPPRALFN